MVTISPDLTKIWKVVHNLLGNIVSIPGDLVNEFKEDNVAPLACVNNKGTLVVTYRGKLHFHVYELKGVDHETYKKKESINLRREIVANGNPDFPFTPNRDLVRRIKFDGGEEGTHLRIYMVVDGKDFISDI